MGSLVAKLEPPDITDALPRQRLPMPAALPRYKLILILAGAGYGKTTLAGQLMARTCARQVWFRPDPADRNPVRFFKYLKAGIQSHFPGFRMSPEFEDRDRLIAWEMESLAADFLDELESCLADDFFLVVDDCQVLERSPAVAGFFQALLDRFCPRFHILLAGRSLPALKFSGLAARRQILRIREPDLAFDQEETHCLFSRIFGLDLSREEVGAVWARTRGWAAGLVLFAQSLEQGRLAPGKAVSRLKGSHRYLADFFRENVYEPLPGPERDFLVRTAGLSTLDAGFCNLFLDREDAREILCSLEDRHCFVFPEDEDRTRFHVHPLFQEFLRARLAHDTVPGLAARLSARAAGLYEKRGQGREALTHYILANRIGDAVRLLNRLARPMIKQERPGMLASLLSIVPAHYMDDEPWFQYLQAGYFGLSRQLRTAVLGYEKVLKAFRSNRDEKGECLVLMELAEYYLASGDLRRAEQACKRILAKGRLDPFLTIVVMGHLIQVQALAGRPAEADKLAKKALAGLKDLDDPDSLAMARAWICVARGFRFAFSGGYLKAMELGEEAMPLFCSAGQYRFLFSCYFLISYACFYLGRFSRGAAAADEGIRLSREKGIRDEFSEFLILLRAKNRLELPEVPADQVHQALADCEKSLDGFETSAFPGGVAQACLVRHRALMIQGDARRAEASLRAGLAAIKEDEMPLIKNELYVALSQLLLFGRSLPRKREAFILLKDAEQGLLSSGWHIAWISRVFARYYWACGHRESAYKYMVYSLKICEEESFDTWITAERAWIVPLLVSLYATGSMKPYLERLFRQMGPDIRKDLASREAGQGSREKKAAATLLALVPKPLPEPLTVFFFDRFRLFVGATEITRDQWKSKKALTLFKYMLAMGNRGFLERDLLMEVLWPDEDPQKSAQRFHVAMAAIRKTLEPAIPRRVRSAYIRRSGQAYCIAPGKKGGLDIREFSAAMAQGRAQADPEKAVQQFEKARTLYQGDFLREDPYEEWCIRVRSGYRDELLFALSRIMAHHEIQSDFAGCIAAARAYLDHDPYAEDVVRKLMEYHARAGNAPMVSRIYKGFRQQVEDELRCGVSSQTTALYDRLVSSF